MWRSLTLDQALGEREPPQPVSDPALYVVSEHTQNQNEELDPE